MDNYQCTSYIENISRNRVINFDLQVGATIEAKFEPFTRNALKIEVEEEEDEFEGALVSIEGNEITIKTDSGRIITFTITDQTRIELGDDVIGTLSDLREGLEIKTRVNPGSTLALEIEVED